MKCGSCTFATEKKSKGEMGDAQLGWGGGGASTNFPPQKRYPRQEKKIKSSREEKEPKETPR